MQSSEVVSSNRCNDRLDSIMSSKIKYKDYLKQVMDHVTSQQQQKEEADASNKECHVGVECDGCKGWFHGRCVSLAARIAGMNNLIRNFILKFKEPSSLKKFWTTKFCCTTEIICIHIWLSDRYC